EEPPQATSGSARANRVYQARVAAARASRDLPVQPAVPNGDEARYPKLWGSFSKGLPHNALGEVDRGAYRTYLRAITSEDRQVFEQIPLGGYLKLANPQAAYSIDLTGPDAEKLALRTPAAIASAEMAGEAAELYWHALLRDVPFSDYHTHPLVGQAAADLSSMSDFRGPKEDGKVTPATLFRGMTAGGRRGYYVSQFLLRDIPMSPIRVPQKIRTAVPGKDYLTSAGDWYNVLNGQLAPVNTFEDSPRYIRTGRDLCEYVHRDFIYQAALGACLMLLRMSAPLDGGIPYQYSITQGGFVTYGAADIFHLLATVANLSLKVAWYHKWIVHRRVRPEELGGHLHFTLAGKNDVPFHPDLLGSKALPLTKARFGTHLLAQSYPEGCPPHPSYPAGHAVFAGACMTVLKACFAESWVMPSSVVPTRDGTALEPYKGAELTVGGELDKLAENIAISRDFAGVHWRSDGIEGLALGEAYALGYLRELKFAASEAFTGFNLTTFGGTRLTI
ncbi:MAG: phosphoesterase, partial [Acidobacteria bacterium]|nr:phosphoesterase [Acidobacteriota bacterium]